MRMNFLQIIGFGHATKLFIFSMFISLVTNAHACNGGSYRYGHYGSSVVDYSHLDHLDASLKPTLSEKIRGVVNSHYGVYGRGWAPQKSAQHEGGDSYSHTAGDEGGHGHGHSSVSSQHGGWSGPGYQFAAHNHQKPVVVSPEARNIQKPRRHRKVKVVHVKKLLDE